MNNKDINDNLSLNSPMIYEIISKEGREELERPFNSLLFSGIAAGLCLSFSLFIMGYLKMITDNELIIHIGYTIGFLMVIQGRLQLFTENTITVILPVLKNFSRRNLYRTTRLWSIVFVANLAGTLLAVIFIEHLGTATSAQISAFLSVAAHATEMQGIEIFLMAIPAGLILATMVWMLPSAQFSKTLVILLMTYVISIGGFSHVIAGSTKIFLLYFNDMITLFDTLEYITLAALGNIVGGTFIFSVLVYGQTYKEL